MPRLSPLLLLLLAPRLSAACSTDEDCNLNGACASSACACVPPWRGADCGELDLLPARAPDGALYRRENVSSWCASTLRADDGVWHAVVAQMADNCGLNSWETNSQLVHVTSAAGPEGPYMNETLIREPFSHNPKLARAPDGTYLIFHIGCGDGTPVRMKNCSGGVSPLPPPPPPTRFINGAGCLAPLGGVFPAWASPFGGLSPLALATGAPCAGNASLWGVGAGGRLESAAWPGASLNVDCDSCAAGAVAKLLGDGGAAGAHAGATGGVNFTSAGGGLLQLVGCEGMCLSAGGAGAARPCGSREEPWAATQLHLVPCGAPEAQGWAMAPPARAAGGRAGAPGCGIQDTELLTSRSLDGPWAFETACGPNATGTHPFFPASVDNPAPLFFADGSVGVMFRSYTRASAPLHSSIGIARAPSWRGPWALPAVPIFPGLEEDPFWWHQASTGSYHALFHNMGGCGAVGCHAWSRDGLRWTLSATPAYNYTVAFAGGGATTFSRRERPQLVFDPDSGAPTHLINGVQLPAAQQPRGSQRDYTYSIIVPLRT